jgi:hypothetical protein
LKRLVVLFLYLSAFAADVVSAAEAERLFGASYAKLFAKPFVAGASLSIRRAAWSRNLHVNVYYLDPQTSLVRLTGSQRDLGTVALRSASRVYFYFPRAELLLALPSGIGALPLFGSDFSAEDLLGFGDIAGRLNVAEDGIETLSGVPARRYVLKPREAKDSPYGVVKLWVAHDGGMPLREEFYSAAGALVREVVMEEADGRLPFPTRWRARSYGTRGGESELEFHSFTNNQPLRPEFFTVEGLRRWR